jgi:hypothetical protein
MPPIVSVLYLGVRCYRCNFFNWYSGGEVQLGPLGTAATNRPIVPTPGDYDGEKLMMEWLAGETEVLGENLPQYRFVHHKPLMLPGHEPGPPRWEASD